jgi:hypothetical protein
LSKISDSSIYGEQNIPVHLVSRYSKLPQLLISAIDLIKLSVRRFATKINPSFPKTIPECTMTNQASDNILPLIHPRIGDVCALK